MLLLLFGGAAAKMINVDLKKGAGWYYLGKFVFNGRESDGLVNFNILGVDTHTKLLFYSDGNVDFRDVYNHRKDCLYASKPAHYTKAITIQEGEF